MRLGIDLGGTKTEIVALMPDGSEAYRTRVPTPRTEYRAILETIAGLVVGAEAALGRRGSVGVGIPGTVDRISGRVKNANTQVLNGHPIDQDLTALLGRPVRVTNDANCLAASEASDGAAAGLEVVFAVIIGTGAGGGVALKGQVWPGPNGIGGEWGHNPLPWATADELPGTPCYCGKAGCLETWVSGTGFELTEGRGHKAKEIAALAQAGEAWAETALQRYEDRLARGLATVINLLDPDAIVLGGGMSNLDRLYTNVPPRLEGLIFGGGPLRTKILKNKHGDSSGVRGAAWLWPVAE